MSNLTKQYILEAIRQTAKRNDGIPLGERRFREETGIKRYDCQKYWSTFGQAQPGHNSACPNLEYCKNSSGLL